MESQDGHSVLVAVGAVAAAFAAVLGAFPVVVAFTKKTARRLNPLSRVVDQLCSMQGQLDSLESEMQSNESSTIRGSLERLEGLMDLHAQRQKAVFTTLPVSVMETDREGKVVWSNRQFSRQTGRTPRELKGLGWINTVELKDRERVRQEWGRAVQSRTEYETEVVLATPDGGSHKGFIQSLLMEGCQGDFLGFVITVTDEGAANR